MALKSRRDRLGPVVGRLVYAAPDEYFDKAVFLVLALGVFWGGLTILSILIP